MNKLCVINPSTDKEGRGKNIKFSDILDILKKIEDQILFLNIFVRDLKVPYVYVGFKYTMSVA